MHGLSQWLICCITSVFCLRGMLCSSLLCHLQWCIAKLNSRVFEKSATMALYLTNRDYWLNSDLYKLNFRLKIGIYSSIIYTFVILHTNCWVVLCMSCWVPANANSTVLVKLWYARVVTLSNKVPRFKS